MNILGLSTATEMLAVCLKKKDGKIITASMQSGFQHATQLIVWIDWILQKGGITAGELDLIACSIGPGSFTGLRIGLAAAKGLSAGLNIPVVGVPTLESFAFPFHFFPGIVVPVLDARKKCFYSALFSNGARITSDMDIQPDALWEILKKYDRVLVTGPMACFFKGKDDIISIDPLYCEDKTFSLVELGAVQYKKYGPADAGLSPVYIRKSEAEMHLNGDADGKTTI